VQDHRLKFTSLKTRYWFWKNKWEQWKLQRKLMLQVWVWRPSVFEDTQSLRFMSVWSQEPGISYPCRRNITLEHRLFQRKLEGIGCLSTEARIKRTIVHLYNHYSTTPVLSTHTTDTTLSTLVNSPKKEWISNYSFIWH